MNVYKYCTFIHSCPSYQNQGLFLVAIFSLFSLSALLLCEKVGQLCEGHKFKTKSGGLCEIAGARGGATL